MLDAIIAFLSDPAHAALIVTVASSLWCSLTPTPSHDPDNPSVARKLYRIVELLALNFGRVKERG